MQTLWAYKQDGSYRGFPDWDTPAPDEIVFDHEPPDSELQAAFDAKANLQPTSATNGT